MRSPVDVRRCVGVRKAGTQGPLAVRSGLPGPQPPDRGPDAAAEARQLLDWLIAHPSPGFAWLCWGYPYPWQDVGFFAPRDFPNRVVTSFVGQALLDGYETLEEQRYLDVASQAVSSCWTRPRRCSRTSGAAA